MSNTSDPPAVHQTSSNPGDSSPSCVFCTIASTYQPIDPQDVSSQEWDPDKLDPPGYVLLSTANAIAFLDIAPLTRGHVLVAPRKHRTKMGDLNGQEMAEIGRLLPLIARSVMRSSLPDIPHDEVDYNIVQNNGPGAAQVIPHLHFHIVPRPPLNYQPPPITSTVKSNTQPKLQSKSKYPPSQLPTGLQQSYIQFGRGQRHELDDEDAGNLVQLMRENVREEWNVEFPSNTKPPQTQVSTAQTDTNSGSNSQSGIERFTGGVEDAAWIEGSGGLVSNLERRTGKYRGSTGRGRGQEKL